AAVEGEIVGDVDQRVDGAQADGDQPLLHPFRRRAVPDPAHQPDREAGAQVRRLDRHLDRAVALAGDRRNRVVLQLAGAGSGGVAGDAVDAGRVGAGRRQVDLDDRIVEPGPGGEAGADRRVPGKVDDAGVLV